MSIWRWADKFSDAPHQHRISLGEGETPLLRSRRIGPSIGADNLYFKLETTNPTGSYKDRFAAAAVADMLARGKRRCVATSSGNTGSALAAYCAAAGIECEIATIETAPHEKLKQMMAYGAQIYKVRGFGTDPAKTAQIFELIERKANTPDAALQISAFRYSPAGMRGVQTIGYELAEQTEGKLDHVFVPAGGGGLTLAVARGLEEMLREGRFTRPVKVRCVQPEGNDTIATPLRRGDERARAVDCTTRIGGLQVASVIDGDEVIAACRRSGGSGHVVDDESVWRMQSRLAREEGIFTEPAGAVAVMGAINSVERGEVAKDATIVCLVTGTGFKDSPSIDRMLEGQSCPVVDLDQLVDAPRHSWNSIKLS